MKIRSNCKCALFQRSDYMHVPAAFPVLVMTIRACRRHGVRLRQILSWFFDWAGFLVCFHPVLPQILYESGPAPDSDRQRAFRFDTYDPGTIRRLASFRVCQAFRMAVYPVMYWNEDRSPSKDHSRASLS